MMDLFDEKALKPMLIKDQKEAFDSEDYIYEIKFDGIRCIAYLDQNGTDLRNKRDKKLLPQVPELKEIHKAVLEKCILDGELVIMRNDITDFYEIQRRALMSDPFKIKLAGDKYPATFIAYDILYDRDHPVNEMPLMARKTLLAQVVKENERICVSRYIERNGIQLYELTKQIGLEGIVAKRKNSKYYFDKRTSDWIKCKVMQMDDCVVCGYIMKENNMTSLVLGQYDQGSLIYKGHVTLGVSLRILNQLPYQKISYSPFSYVPKGNEEAIWLAPTLVCIVESMPNDKDSFRQPVFRGFRDDKAPEECTVG